MTGATSTPSYSSWSDGLFKDATDDRRSRLAVTNINISSTEYARRCRDLMNLHRDLVDLGAGTVFDLPRIAVIGKQSAGKSSLVEAVTGIKVPRDSGTCTRCPIECRMSSSTESWFCNVSLRFDHDATNLQQTGMLQEFATNLTDRKEVELWIRRAQLAILSPHQDPSFFKTKHLAELRDISKSDTDIRKFSMDAVVIDIYDPHTTDLLFVDLPGLIENEDLEVIQLVLSLVESYITERNTLILVTIPMTDEIENQRAVRLAREYDPEGERTIGVLTKPDMLTNASQLQEKWKSILLGEEHPLRHGYYAVRLPNDDERMQDATAELQTRAAEFFEFTSPWSKVRDRGRFGIPNLVRDVGTLLVQLMERNLPELFSAVQMQLAETQCKLSRLPPAIETENHVAEVTVRVSQFCSRFKNIVYGKGEPHTMVQTNRRLYETWKDTISATAPDFRPFENPDDYPMLTDEPDADEPDVDEPEADTRVVGSAIGVKEVRKVIDQSITWELRYNVPFIAKKRLIDGCIERWRKPSMDCFDDVCRQLTETMLVLLGDHFGLYKKLQSHIRSLMHAEIETRKREARESVSRLLDLDSAPLYTQNDHYFSSLRAKWLIRYKNARFNHGQAPSPAPSSARKTNTYPTDYEGEALRSLQGAGYKGLTKQSFVLLRPPDQYEQELIVMAEVRAYFQLAYKRIIDILPMTIEHALNQALVNELQERLLRNLLTEEGVPGCFALLLDEDPGIVKERDYFRKHIARLSSVKGRLDAFEKDCVL